MVVYGIDFGTTFTVVSYIQNGKVKFIKFDGSILLPTEESGIKNLKRVILEKSQSNELQRDSTLQVLINFFKYIRLKIQNTMKNEEEYVNCVLTVPVRFNDLARYFIKYAAIAAKFNVIKLIQEPVAAAIASLKQGAKNGQYIVYDLGGGTFDTTLIKKVDDIWQVMKVDGLDNFGGLDLDEYLAKMKGISLDEARQFKESEYFEKFDEILEKTYQIVQKLSKNQEILAIILTGGSSYLKNISNKYNESFLIIKSDNLQTLVAEGAAVYGESYLKQSQFLIDITPFHLGIEVLGDKLEVLIEANSPIPIKKTEKFVPINNQVVINILQGTSFIASDCKKLGKLSLTVDVPFEVDFILDCDGILTVQALDQFFVVSDLFCSD